MSKDRWYVVCMCALVALVLFVSNASAQLQSGPWPKYGQNAANTGQSPHSGPQTNRIDWTYDAAWITEGSMAVGSDGTIYLIADSNLRALNPDGTERWNAGGASGFVTLAQDGTFYTVNYIPEDRLRAFKEIAGVPQLLWEFLLPEPDWAQSNGAAIAGDGTIYLATLLGNLYAVLPDGTLDWTFAAGGDTNGCPALAPDGTIYFGTTAGKVYAINPDGTQKWSRAVTGGICDSPAVGGDGTVYVMGTAGTAYAFTPQGTQKWKKSLGGTKGYGQCKSPSVHEASGNVLVGGAKALVALRANNGTTAWQFADGYQVAHAVIGADGKIYFSSRHNTTPTVYALNADGTVVWSRTIENPNNGRATEAVLGADGTLYVGLDDLLAFHD